MTTPVKKSASSPHDPHRGRLTPRRRQVLTLLGNLGGSATAYELLRELAVIRPTAARPTIYRTLHFLMEEGLVKRVATTHTFMACEPGSRGTLNTSCMHALWLYRCPG